MIKAYAWSGLNCMEVVMSGDLFLSVTKPLLHLFAVA